MTKVPTFDQLMNPLITALRDLGGSGSINEIYERVIQNLKLSEDVLSVLHDPEASNQTEVHYRLAWARTYLKKYGALTNSSRGIWSLAKPDLTTVDPRDVIKVARDADKKGKQTKNQKAAPEAPETDTPEEAQSWRTKLHHILVKQIDPPSFERLIQRLLRESGFVQVEVTGRTGDGGIDGKGIARIHGFMSFHVVSSASVIKVSYRPVISATSVGRWLVAQTRAFLLQPAHSRAMPSKRPLETALRPSTLSTVTNSPTSSKTLASAPKPK